MGSITLQKPGLFWGDPEPREAGVSPSIAFNLANANLRGENAGLHALLIVRNGKLGFESYLPGRDENWGRELESTEHSRSLNHDLRSISKSIVSLLYGIALGLGLVPPPEARLVETLPEYRFAFSDDRKRSISIGHVLSMRMGIAWNEDFQYANPANAERRMELVADRIQFILEQPMAAMPGRRWIYSGATTVLLGSLIERGTGRTLSDFAQEMLFGPLGIEGAQWSRWPDGRPAASSGLRMTARNLARIGQMTLDKGLWNGSRVVPANWLVASTRPRARAEGGLRYGYQWWLGQLSANGKPWYAGYGNGGQRLIVVPSLRLVVVIFAGNYNRADQWKLPIQLMSRIVLPAIL